MNLKKKFPIAILSLTILISTISFSIPENVYKNLNINTTNTAEAKAKPNRGIVYKYYSQTYSVKKLKNPPYLHERQLKNKVIAKYGKLRPVKVKWKVKMIIGRSTMNAVSYKPVSITAI
ncbi:hypothetical protein ACFP67_14880 [Mammaliicoccus sciuri]|uniref:hypothetical protein n=1 Tax=Mammaliicoccus sciuri TaxID=1296 RepID=UPI000CD131EC|nr:hypothetical protein [Mammaliicoccus sciuri]MDT0696985.1 hypothetical protein [Mammaliicoccus sciuri]MDT0704377.1 hypothetical protein [Mammaliicoccus sciuri]MDT0712261.1 hypothetical protein [Mammaliicoccus sciuri]PNZ27373.1 hypothetical protein CD114_05800 [Mammaliicoccus sciuri]